MLVKTILRAKGTEVVTAQADATVAQIARLLRDKRIGCVVIAEAGGRIAGIVSERDIVQGLANEGPAFLDRRASQAMVREVVSCTAETSVEELMMLMTARRIRHLPVVENGRLTGIVSIGDVVKNRLDELESEAVQLRNYIVGA
ncbi:MAG TPA: CBS domain-containing protein [Alphaproteobacteria bacterium]|nr:CBS domain-containing protein [Alphaproteobacteria bacterium]